MPGPICSLPSFFTSLKEILSKCTFSWYNLLNLQNMLNSNMLGMLHVAGYLSRYLVTSITFCQISSTQPDSTWLVIGSHLISRIQPNPMVGYPVNWNPFHHYNWLTHYYYWLPRMEYSYTSRTWCCSQTCQSLHLRTRYWWVHNKGLFQGRNIR